MQRSYKMYKKFPSNVQKQKILKNLANVPSKCKKGNSINFVWLNGRFDLLNLFDVGNIYSSSFPLPWKEFIKTAFDKENWKQDKVFFCSIFYFNWAFTKNANYKVLKNIKLIFCEEAKNTLKYF